MAVRFTPLARCPNGVVAISRRFPRSQIDCGVPHGQACRCTPVVPASLADAAGVHAGACEPTAWVERPVVVTRCEIVLRIHSKDTSSNEDTRRILHRTRILKGCPPNLDTHRIFLLNEDTQLDSRGTSKLFWNGTGVLIVDCTALPAEDSKTPRPTGVAPIE